MVLALFALAAAVAAPADTVSPAADGTWRFADAPAAYDARTSAAIDAAVASMNFALRPIARRMLAEKVEPCQRYVFTPSPERFTYQCDDYPPVEAPWSGSGVYIDKEGGRVPFSVTSTSSSVSISFKGESGNQQTTFRFADGAMTVDKVITSDKLPDPLTWGTAYRR